MSMERHNRTFQEDHSSVYFIDQFEPCSQIGNDGSILRPQHVCRPSTVDAEELQTEVPSCEQVPQTITDGQNPIYLGHRMLLSSALD